MISVVYRAPGVEAPLVVEQDERLLFWPFRVRGELLLAGDLVERSWRGATLREAVEKAARCGCLALAAESVDAVLVELERQLEARR